MHKILLSFMAMLALSASAVADAISTEKFYFDCEAGVALPESMSGNNGVKVNLNPGPQVDVAFGYQLARSWSLELQSGWIDNSSKHLSSIFYAVPSGPFGTIAVKPVFHQDLETIPILANIIYTLPLKGPFKFYVGTGFGAVFSEFNVRSILGDNGRSDVTFGYQETAGVKYRLSNHWNVGLNYKYLGTTDHALFYGSKSDGTMIHSLMAAVTYKF